MTRPQRRFERDAAMNRLGIHAAVFVGGWDATSAAHAIRSASAAGYDLIEVPVFTPHDIDVEGTARLLNEAHLAATCSLGLPRDSDISSPDESIARRGVEYLRAAVEVAAGIGSDYVGGVTYGALGRHDAPLPRAGRDASLRGVREVASFAADHGVRLGLECVNRYESNLINTAEQALAYLDELDHSNVVIHLDSYHANIEEADVAAAIVACGDRLGYVHIGENHRGELGKGQIDLTAWADGLERISYGGVITFESFSSAIVDRNLSHTLAIWRDTWTDPHEVARNSRRRLVEAFTADRGRTDVSHD